jgi:hypothetical protein
MYGFEGSRLMEAMILKASATRGLRKNSRGKRRASCALAAALSGLRSSYTFADIHPKKSRPLAGLAGVTLAMVVSKDPRDLISALALRVPGSLILNHPRSPLTGRPETLK